MINSFQMYLQSKELPPLAADCRKYKVKQDGVWCWHIPGDESFKYVMCEMGAAHCSTKKLNLSEITTSPDALQKLKQWYESDDVWLLALTKKRKTY